LPKVGPSLYDRTLYLLMQRRPNHDHLAAILANKAFQWPRLIDLALAELVGTALAERLTAHRVWHFVPDDAREAIVALEEIGELRCREQTRQIESVARLLQSRGIQAVFTKGAAALISGLYPTRAARFLTDIDFLIPQDRIAESVALLEASGYVPDPLTLGIFRAHHSTLSNEAIAAIRHYPRMFHDDFDSGVEPHSQLFGTSFDLVLPGADLIARAVTVPHEGLNLAIPSLPDQLLHNILHLVEAVDFPFEARPSLRQSIDFILLREQLSLSQWQAIVQTLLAAGLGFRLSLLLAYLEHWLDYVPAPAAHKSLGASLLQQAHRIQIRLIHNQVLRIMTYFAAQLWRLLRTRRLSAFLSPAFYRPAFRRAAARWKQSAEKPKKEFSAE
jgi:hypothetical protein